MPLSQPAVREPLHSRDIELRGYRRADGLYDIEARLTDTKAYVFTNHDRGDIVPGTPLHGMFARMTLNEDMTIVQFEAVTDYGPYAICPSAAPGFAALAGLKVGRGFTRAANERVGGIKGCTHLRELLGQMATVAFQTLYPIRLRQQQAADPAQRPVNLNTCLAYAEDGPVVQRIWPQFYTGSDA